VTYAEDYLKEEIKTALSVEKHFKDTSLSSLLACSIEENVVEQLPHFTNELEYLRWLNTLFSQRSKS
jgi:hypothetical protein